MLQKHTQFVAKREYPYIGLWLANQLYTSNDIIKLGDGKVIYKITTYCEGVWNGLYINMIQKL